MSKEKLIYFAYGSNLHPNRLESRIGKSHQLGILKLVNYKLELDKLGADGSTKCNIVKNPCYFVYGALFSITSKQKSVLDRYEAGYSTSWMHDETHGKYFTYLANPPFCSSSLPYHWYKILVVLGAGYHNFPPCYLNMLGCLNSVRDEKLERTRENLKIFH